MPIWMLPVEILAKIALRYGLNYLETKYPGIKPIIEEIKKILDGAQSPQVAEMLKTHVAEFKDRK